MIVVGGLMLRGAAATPAIRRRSLRPGQCAASCSAIGAGSRRSSPGFFGIGGGFLIVPGLIAATGMPMINAIGSSLVAVIAFGLTTAAELRAVRARGLDARRHFHRRRRGRRPRRPALAQRLSSRGALTTIFAALVFAVAAYVLWRSAAM